MAKSFSKFKVILILALSAVMAFAAFTFVNIADADGEKTFKMRETAEMRLVDGVSNSGIRFVVDMDEDTKDLISSSYEFGFLIAKAEDFSGVSEDYHSHAHIDVKFNETQRENNIYFDKRTGTYRANGVLVNIKEVNYDVLYTAVAYYKESQSSNYVYAERGQVPVARSIRGLAQAAYLDNTLDVADRNDIQLSIRSYLGFGASEQTPIMIYNEEQFADMVNMPEPAFYQLATDIELTPVSLGTDKNVNKFERFIGKLDGNGKKISFDINYGVETMFTGLIGELAYGASVKNTIFEGSVLSKYGGGQGVFFKTVYGTIDSCVFTVDMKTPAAFANGPFGIIKPSARIKDCVVIDNSTQQGNNIISNYYDYETDDQLAIVENYVYIGTMYSQWQNRIPKYNGSYELSDGGVRPYPTLNNVYMFKNANEALGISQAKYLAVAKNGANDQPGEWEVQAKNLKNVITSDAITIDNNDTHVQLKVLDGVAFSLTKSTVEIDSADEFLNSMANDGLAVTHKLTADVQIGTESAPYSLVDNNVSGDQLFRTLNGTIDGNGHSLIMYVSASDRFGAGIFGDINGTIKNVELQVKYVTVCSTARTQGVLAQTLNGSIKDSLIIFTDGFNDHSSSMGLVGHMGALASVTNCFVNASSTSGNVRLIAATADQGARIENVAYAKADYKNYQGTLNWLLPNKVITINNLYLTGSKEQVVAGTFTSKLKDSYNGGTTANGSELWESVSSTVELKNIIGEILAQRVNEYVTRKNVIEVATAEQLLQAFNTDSADNEYKLTADVSIGSATEYYSLAAQNITGDQMMSTLNGSIDGNGHKLSFYVDGIDRYGVGVFGTINGNIKNVNLFVKFNTTYGEKVQGQLAGTLNGKIENSIITFLDGFSNYDGNKGLIGHLGATAKISNCLIDAGATSGNVRMFSATADVGAVIENIVYVKTNFLNFQSSMAWMLPKTVITINNLYICNTLAQAEAGTFDNKLKASYNGGTIANGTTDIWEAGGTVALSSILSGITVTDGIASFTD